MYEKTILTEEDDPPIHPLISTKLRTHGYKFLTADNGNEALMEISTHNPDIVLLDLGLPDIDGIEVIRRVRTWSNLPIIVISARSEENDKIDALDAGADDYLTKPFSVEELLARIRVTIRRLAFLRNAKEENESVYVNGKLSIDFAAGSVTVAEQPVHLTPSEYKLVCILARHTGKVLTYRMITKEVWGNSWENNMASLRVYMASLRKKLEKASGGDQFIKTHVGVGYQMLKL